MPLEYQDSARQRFLMALGITALSVVILLVVVAFLRPGGGNEVQTDGKPPFSNLNRCLKVLLNTKTNESLVRMGEEFKFGKALFQQCIVEPDGY